MKYYLSTLLLFFFDKIFLNYLQVLTIRFTQNALFETLLNKILLPYICSQYFVLVNMIKSMVATSFVDLLLLLDVQIKMLDWFWINFSTPTDIWNWIYDLSNYSWSLECAWCILRNRFDFHIFAVKILNSKSRLIHQSHSVFFAKRRCLRKINIIIESVILCKTMVVLATYPWFLRTGKSA